MPGVAWQTIYGVFRRWTRDGVMERILQALDWEHDVSECAVDATHIKVHKDGANPCGGQQGQCLGRTKGGLNTKIHALVDRVGKPVAIVLTAGQAGDAPQAINLLSKAPGLQTGIMDKAYDSDQIREWLRAQGARACIPPRSNRLRPAVYDKRTYKRRHRIENFFEKLKRTRRTATRYDKLASTFSSFVFLSIACLFLRNQF
jgi:transposase